MVTVILLYDFTIWKYNKFKNCHIVHLKCLFSYLDCFKIPAVTLKIEIKTNSLPRFDKYSLVSKRRGFLLMILRKKHTYGQEYSTSVTLACSGFLWRPGVEKSASGPPAVFPIEILPSYRCKSTWKIRGSPGKQSRTTAYVVVAQTTSLWREKCRANKTGRFSVASLWLYCFSRSFNWTVDPSLRYWGAFAVIVVLFTPGENK